MFRSFSLSSFVALSLIFFLSSFSVLCLTLSPSRLCWRTSSSSSATRIASLAWMRACRPPTRTCASRSSNTLRCVALPPHNPGLFFYRCVISCFCCDLLCCVRPPPHVSGRRLNEFARCLSFCICVIVLSACFAWWAILSVSNFLLHRRRRSLKRHDMRCGTASAHRRSCVSTWMWRISSIANSPQRYERRRRIYGSASYQLTQCGLCCALLLFMLDFFFF